MVLPPLRTSIGALLESGYRDAALRSLEAISRTTNQPEGAIQTALRALDQEVARLDANGLPLLLDNPALRALLSDIDAASTINTSLLNVAGVSASENAAQISGEATFQETLLGIDNRRLLGTIRDDWNAVDPEAVVRLVGYVDSPGWQTQLGAYEQGLNRSVRENIVRGFITGQPAAKTARDIRRAVETIPRSTANTITRTIYMQSYRTGTAINQNANARLIHRVVRIETLDERTCMACVALHGRVIWDRERDGGRPITRISEHHNGRGIARTIIRGSGRSYESGKSWFARQSPARQRKQFANNAAYKAYSQGRINLDDMVQEYTDPVFTVNDQYTDAVFGDMIRESSLKGILGDAAREFYS